MKFVSESDISRLDAILDSSGRFVLLNMFSEGIWYVDKHHSRYPKIKETALLIAKMFGDKDVIESLENDSYVIPVL